MTGDINVGIDIDNRTIGIVYGLTKERAFDNENGVSVLRRGCSCC
jgi:hypothetical protein